MTYHSLLLYGPPGTGKTTRLTHLAIGAVNSLGGADRLGALTYTRTAALELKMRIAARLGIRVPEEARTARHVLDQAIPWVGTIHSLCYRLIGRPKTITGTDLNAFAHSVDPRTTADFKGLPSDPSDLEGFEYSDVAALDEIELALKLHAAARHRMIPLAEAWPLVTERGALDTTPERIAGIVSRYERWKTEINKIDFEDMLEWGRDMRLPVRVLLCDEVQDNSALLWSVIDAWAPAARLLACAGDPWQAIHIFSGAKPELFRERQGKWLTLGNSRRLSASSARYALDLLRYAGYGEDSLLSTWTGEGGFETEGGSRFYLARTHALLRPLREDLESNGEPYRLLRGLGPLQVKAAQAYRAYLQGKGNGVFTYAQAHLIADQSGPNSLPRGYKSKYEHGSADEPDAFVDIEDNLPIAAAAERIPHRRYYDRLVARHGMAGMILPPKIQVGTIHGAKGREADQVHLVRSWGFLPGRAISEGHAREEACVAYVGCSRHRQTLTFIDGLEGIPYRFPRQYEEAPHVGRTD